VSGTGDESDVVLHAAREWRQEIDDLASLFAIVSLNRMTKLADENISELLRSHQITFPRFTALARLYWTDRPGVPLGEIAQFLLVHPTSITSVVDRLERDGLAVRSPHPTDRRATLASITPKCRELIRKMTPQLIEQGWGFRQVSRDKLVKLALLLREIREDAGDTVGDERAYLDLAHP
jgi:DNA-binding MarR family transcriptional regulator